MQLSIREASRFVIGTALLRAQAMQHAEHAQMLTFDNVAAAVLQPTQEGKQLRQTVEAMADREAGWFRSNPPHAMSSDRVMQSRAAEVAALKRIGGAAVSTLLYGPRAIAGDGPATEQLTTIYSGAYTAIDAAPGSTNDRRSLMGLLHEQTQRLSSKPEMIRALLSSAEKRCLARQADAILSRYEKSLGRSEDFEP
ncbi:hypothetical protein [Achromobacter insolitus]|uniref:hypothetical protein n=1 Tax=Achromobacter insolitus TaxID=217204 RepID=UPI0007C3A4A4|nr:hypothetical protein [Achromobacter insolitus]OAD16443.1 hypothetical protein A3839_28230 [Achromobacter insolitus]